MEYFSKSGPVKKTSYVVGFLDENMDNDFHNQILAGILEAAGELDVGIIRFGYYSSHIAYKFSHQADMVLDQIQQYDLDGLLFLGWTQAGAMYNHDEFLKRFGSIPLLSIGTIYDDLPCVYFSGDDFIEKITRHLVEDHHYTRIAYIEHYREDNRAASYEKVMREYGIYDPMLYIGNDVLPGGIDRKGRSKKAVEVIFDERKLDVRAIISLNYIDTGFLIKELAGRGYRIPGDIAVVSYEEGGFAEYSYPAYTTVYFPWKELGYEGCRNMVRLLENGSIPKDTDLGKFGRIICRESCGCLPYKVKLIDTKSRLYDDNSTDGMTPSEISDIVTTLNIKYTDSGMSFEKIADALMVSCKRRDNKIFLTELDSQLRIMKVCPRINELVSDIRNLFYPYLFSDKEMMLWSGELFMQSQVLVSEKAASMHGEEVLRARIIDQELQTITQQLFLSFTLKNLIGTLDKGMKIINIDRCHIFISNSIFTGSDVEENLFDNSVLIFRYRNGRSEETTGKAGNLKQQLREIQSNELGRVSLAYQLHVTDEIMGFALFGPGEGLMDEKFYQTLSTSISTVLHGIVLLNRLDMAYRKLVEHAQREGMADIAANILHNIGNILNSINVTLHMMEENAKAQVVDDIIMAGSLLQKNMHRLEKFISSDEKGKKLMDFYLKLRPAAERLQMHLQKNTDRLWAKIRTINEAVSAQQNYAGTDTKLEDLLIEPIIEDALKLHQDSFEKLQIDVSRDYTDGIRSYVHRAKLFFIIFNIISNAKDALINSSVEEKRIAVRTYQDAVGKYLSISDNGRGVREGCLNRIFDYGFSTKEGRYGYGLYSCASYMADMGGSIWAESDGEGKGASFILRFL